MSYSIERLTKYPALVATFHQDFDMSQELATCFAAVIPLLDKEQTPITVIVDILQSSLSVDALMEGTKVVLTGKSNPVKHANTRRFVVVTHSSLVALSLDGFRKLGIGDVNVAKSVEEVLRT